MAKTPKRPRDPNQLAKLIVDIATGDGPLIEAKPTKITPGRPGGLVGGKARTIRLSDVERSEIARKAARARWKSETYISSYMPSLMPCMIVKG